MPVNTQLINRCGQLNFVLAIQHSLMLYFLATWQLLCDAMISLRFAAILDFKNDFHQFYPSYMTVLLRGVKIFIFVMTS